VFRPTGSVWSLRAVGSLAGVLALALVVGSFSACSSHGLAPVADASRRSTHSAPANKPHQRDAAASNTARGTRYAAPLFYTVKSGETLYSIAWRYGLDYKRIARLNGVKSDYVIHPGQRLQLHRRPTPVVTPESAPNPARVEKGSRPDRAKKPTAAPQRAANAASTRIQPVVSPPAPKPKPRTQGPKASSTRKSTAHAPVWRWPTDGKVVATFDATNAARQGLDIAGKRGQPVWSAADGEVVYSGSGLVGYGNLVIVKHDESFLSAYGHNRVVRVAEGDRVRGGERIAEMGQRPGQGSVLHFEIRKDGRPVDPLRYLPKR